MSDQKPSNSESTFGSPMFLSPGAETWRKLKVEADGADPAERQQEIAAAKSARDDLRNFLLTSLQMQHVVVLAGSGTSLGKAGGPSMWALWDHCVNENPNTGEAARIVHSKAKAVIDEVQFDAKVEGENIEALLSRCEAYLQVKPSEKVIAFVSASRKLILEMCSRFLDDGIDGQLDGHRSFLHRLSRRRTRDSRLKLFTTNYDLCFESSASKLGLVVIDGFSFTQPRVFDPRFYLYDIVRRPSASEEIGVPLEGVFQLYKLHGSVNWERSSADQVELVDNPDPDNACIIYPARGKYQQSYVQPHLEAVAQYLAALRAPNTCLIVVGFGFNDDHLSEPILASVQSNPHLRLIVVDPSADDLTARPKTPNRYWKSFLSLARQEQDVCLINAFFADFAEMIPDLKSLTPSQRIAREIKQMVREAL